MYIKAYLPESVEIKEQNAFSLMVPILLFSILHSPYKALLAFFQVRVKQQLTAFDFLLCSVSVIFLCVSVYAYACLHISPLKNQLY